MSKPQPFGSHVSLFVRLTAQSMMGGYLSSPKFPGFFLFE